MQLRTFEISSDSAEQGSQDCDQTGLVNPNSSPTNTMWMAECPPASCVPLSAHGLQGVADQAAQAPVQHVSSRI